MAVSLSFTDFKAVKNLPCCDESTVIASSTTYNEIENTR